MKKSRKFLLIGALAVVLVGGGLYFSLKSDIFQHESKYLKKVAFKEVEQKDVDTLLVGKSQGKSATSEVISTNAKYQTNPRANPGFPDELGKKLTDGVQGKKGQNYTDSIWSGYLMKKGNLEVELNFGKEVTDISAVGASMAYNLKSDVKLADEMEIWATNTKAKDYKLVGTYVFPKDEALQEANTTPVVHFQKGLTANKIKIKFVKPRGKWIFLGEAFAEKAVEENQEKSVKMESIKSYYPDEVISKKEIKDLPTSEINNLAPYANYRMEEKNDIAPTYRTKEYNTQLIGNGLVDGEKAKNPEMSDPAWVRFTKGKARSLYFDFKENVTLSEVKMNFLKDDKVGIPTPLQIIFSMSLDGENWTEVGESGNFDIEESKTIYPFQHLFETPYKTRYLKVYFTVAPHVYMDEVEVMGTKNLDNTQELPAGKKEEVRKEAYANSETFGFKDTLLTYIPGTKDANNQVTKELIKPYVSYVKDGKIEDTLFDSYLFLPYVKFLYDGQEKKALKKADWQEYMESQFLPDQNMSALDATLEETKKALSLPDYKAKVFMSIFYPVSTIKDFGEVNGKHLDFSKKEDRLAATKWMVAEQEKMFKAQNYKNLELAGFYWFTEEISFSDTEVTSLIKGTTDYVKSLGYINTWIPYHQAVGYDLWEELGFDLACYQPGYAFNYSIGKERVYETAAEAKKLGMSVEMEAKSIDPIDVTRMKEYFAVSKETGIMEDAIHMYYQSGMPGVFYDAYQSKDPYAHSLYDDLHKFIKHTFETDLKGPDKGKFEVKANRPLDGIIKGKPIKAILQYSVSEAPKYGTVTLLPDGKFTYVPYKDFKGKDSFSVSYDYGYQLSEPTEIQIEVK